MGAEAQGLGSFSDALLGCEQRAGSEMEHPRLGVGNTKILSHGAGPKHTP